MAQRGQDARSHHRGAPIYKDIKTKGAASRFVQAGKSIFALNPNAPPSSGGTTDAALSQGAGSAGESSGGSGPVTGELKKRLSFTDAAEDVLRRHGDGQPMHYRDITKKVLEEDLVKTSGKTPEATLYAQVITENARAEKRGKAPRFVRHGKGLVGLTAWLEPGVQQEIAKHNPKAEQEMLDQVRAMDPADFEQLVGELLRALSIRDVDVTAYHGDKGIDATGVYELAPALEVRIVVQAKRQQANVGRPVVRTYSSSATFKSKPASQQRCADNPITTRLYAGD